MALYVPSMKWFDAFFVSIELLDSWKSNICEYFHAVPVLYKYFTSANDWWMGLSVLLFESHSQFFQIRKRFENIGQLWQHWVFIFMLMYHADISYWSFTRVLFWLMSFENERFLILATYFQTYRDLYYIQLVCQLLALAIIRPAVPSLKSSHVSLIGNETCLFLNLTKNLKFWAGGMGYPCKELVNQL